MKVATLLQWLPRCRSAGRAAVMLNPFSEAPERGFAKRAMGLEPTTLSLGS